MVKSPLNAILKAAHYADESGLAPDHRLTAVLIPVPPIGGAVFGVLQTHGDESSAELLETTIRDDLERLAQTMEVSVNITHRFEQLLQAINERLALAYREGTLHLPISEAAAVIGVADQNSVIISGFGNLTATFLHKTEKGPYEQYDLSRGLRVEDEVASWPKAFLTVLNGDLHAGDVLYVGSRINRHDLSPIDVNEILTTLPPTGAVNKIRQHLPLQSPFAAVVLQTQKVAAESRKTSGLGAQGSLSSLHRTAEKTEHYLAEQAPDLQRALLRTLRIFFPRRGAAHRARLLKESGHLAIRLAVIAVKVSFGIGRDLVLMGWRLGRMIVSRPQEILERTKTTVAQTNKRTGDLIIWFNRLSKMNKRIGGAFLIALAIFFGGLVLLNRQNKIAAEEVAYRTAVENVETILNTAEASLIYGDTAQAQELLEQAEAKIAALTFEPKKEKKESERLTAKLTEIQKTLRQETQPRLVPVLVDQVEEIFGQPVTPASLGLTRPGIDVQVYNGKAYLLSPENNQIFKHSRSGDGFDGGSAWIISRLTDLSDAVSLAVDGYVWVVKSNGQIIRYLSGREEEALTPTVIPPLAAPLKIWTDENSSFLYVVEPSSQRIIVLKKNNAAFVRQYVDPAFEQLEQMKIDEASKTIYVKIGETIFQFAAQHI